MIMTSPIIPLTLAFTLFVSMVVSYPSAESESEMDKRLKIPMMSRLRNQQLHGGDYGLTAAKRLKIPMMSRLRNQQNDFGAMSSVSKRLKIPFLSAVRDPTNPNYEAGLRLQRRLAANVMQPEDLYEEFH
ncbi:uncharacterized protein LOC142341057 [Convolutriloba macropyga]|uniref:uncharacterized protein LOC142341057 n=1 Tax=Convolutriloba macropyga TaxID=536237 RepID=UPI003F51CB15